MAVRSKFRRAQAPCQEARLRRESGALLS